MSNYFEAYSCNDNNVFCLDSFSYKKEDSIVVSEEVIDNDIMVKVDLSKAFNFKFIKFINRDKKCLVSTAFMVDIEGIYKGIKFLIVSIPFECIAKDVVG